MLFEKLKFFLQWLLIIFITYDDSLDTPKKERGKLLQAREKMQKKNLFRFENIIILHPLSHVLSTTQFAMKEKEEKKVFHHFSTIVHDKLMQRTRTFFSIESY
jgi:hypothetical protein